MNKVFLIGNLGADAELRTTPNGVSMLKFNVATSEKWLDKAGEKQERTEWHRCTSFKKGCDKLAQYLTKGSKISVEGSIRTSTYDKDGEKRYSTEINVENVELLGGKATTTDAAEPDPFGVE